MTDQLEHDLTTLFDTTATRTHVPLLPLERVLAEGRTLQRVRRRRATLWSAAAAAVAVVAVVLPLAVAGHHTDNRPAPAHHSIGPSPDANGVPTTPTPLPYLTGVELHVGEGDRVIGLTGKPSAFISHGGTTLYFDTKTSRWWRVREGQVEPYGPAYSNEKPWTSTFSPQVSADGRTIAVLTHPTPNTSRITDYDAATDKVLGQIDLDEPFANWTGGGDSVELTAVNDDGRVYWTQMDSTTSWRMWKPGAAAPIKPHVELDGNGEAYPPNGAITAAGQVVTFADDGTPHPIDGLPSDADLAAPVWSPSGAVLASENIGGEPGLIDLDEGSATVRPPADFTILQWFGFESDAYVIGAAAVDRTPAAVVRCATDRSACTVIGELPAGWENWEWATSPPTDAGATATDTESASTAADPIAALPQGTPADIPTLTNGVVRVGDQVIAEHVGAVRASSDRSILLLQQLDGGVVVWSASSGTKTLTGRQSDPVPPVVSPDGRYAVTAYQDTIEEWSLPAGQLIGSLPYPNAILELLVFNGVDNSGRLYATTHAPRSGFTWKPGSTTEPLTGAASEFSVTGIGGVGRTASSYRRPATAPPAASPPRAPRRCATSAVGTASGSPRSRADLEPPSVCRPNCRATG